MAEGVHHIYCDESRQCKDRYMVLGGIIVPVANVAAFNETMKKYRAEFNINGELKWSKVSKTKFTEYKSFVDYFFALINTDKIHFKCVIIDNHKVNHKKFSEGDKEKGFYKFYYQLLFNCFGRQYYSPDKNTKFLVHPDNRSSKYSLTELKDILNNGMAKQFGQGVRPFIAIEPKNSHDSDPVQINDIILGAVGFQKNDYHLLGTSSVVKKDLAQYIADKAGIKFLGNDTKYGQSRFSVWNFRLRE